MSEDMVIRQKWVNPIERYVVIYTEDDKEKYYKYINDPSVLKEHIITFNAKLIDNHIPLFDVIDKPEFPYTIWHNPLNGNDTSFLEIINIDNAIKTNFHIHSNQRYLILAKMIKRDIKIKTLNLHNK